MAANLSQAPYRSQAPALLLCAQDEGARRLRGNSASFSHSARNPPTSPCCCAGAVHRITASPSALPSSSSLGASLDPSASVGASLAGAFASASLSVKGAKDDVQGMRYGTVALPLVIANLPSSQEKERMNPGASGLFAAQSLSVWRQTQPGAPHR